MNETEKVLIVETKDKDQVEIIVQQKKMAHRLTCLKKVESHLEDIDFYQIEMEIKNAGLTVQDLIDLQAEVTRERVRVSREMEHTRESALRGIEFFLNNLERSIKNPFLPDATGLFRGFETLNCVMELNESIEKFRKYYLNKYLKKETKG